MNHLGVTNTTGIYAEKARRGPRINIAYLFVGPAFIIVIPLVLYPVVISVLDSFRVDDLLYPTMHNFVGFQNYARVLADPQFLQSAGNTAIYLILATVGALLLGHAMAFWLHGIHRFRGLFLALLILPWAVPGTVTGLLWSFIYNPASGLLNSVLKSLHIISQNVVWFSGSHMDLVYISLPLIWQSAPITAIILLAGLETIPPNLYEAAEIDGSSVISTFLRITMPLLRPSLAIGLLNAGIAGIGIFDQIYVLNGYAGSTKSVVVQTYLYAFQNLNFGQGISASFIITIVTFVVSLVYLKFVYREVVFS